MSTRVSHYRRQLAIAEYRKQRKIWSRPVAYWIAIWRHGKGEKTILGAMMLNAFGVSAAEINHYEQEPPA